eukprot:Skav231775  [mRNA]  locus=scaffold3283:82114:83752:+ [translate_table: standard]
MSYAYPWGQSNWDYIWGYYYPHQYWYPNPRWPPRQSRPNMGAEVTTGNRSVPPGQAVPVTPPLPAAEKKQKPEVAAPKSPTPDKEQSSSAESPSSEVDPPTSPVVVDGPQEDTAKAEHASKPAGVDQETKEGVEKPEKQKKKSKERAPSPKRERRSKEESRAVEKKIKEKAGKERAKSSTGERHQDHGDVGSGRHRCRREPKDNKYYDEDKRSHVNTPQPGPGHDTASVVSGTRPKRDRHRSRPEASGKTYSAEGQVECATCKKWVSASGYNAHREQNQHCRSLQKIAQQRGERSPTPPAMVWHPCQHCSRWFNNEYSLEQHLWNKHGIQRHSSQSTQRHSAGRSRSPSKISSMKGKLVDVLIALDDRFMDTNSMARLSVGCKALRRYVIVAPSFRKSKAAYRQRQREIQEDRNREFRQWWDNDTDSGS